MELKLLYAKDAIFRLIRDYCTPIYDIWRKTNI